MKLFIVGNGFDIKHGLATQYWDFRTFLENMYPEFLHSFEQHYSIYPGMDKAEKRELLWNQLEKNLANIDEEIIIENAISIDMGLESGDVGIEDTLYQYFTDEYKYIQKLAKYLRQWVRTIKIKGVQPKTTLIKKENDAFYITFNYTAVLETVYKVSAYKILHIHGSLRQHDDEPILGHGNEERIQKVQEKRQEAEGLFAEKEISIYRAVHDYYNHTFKNINLYMPKLRRLEGKEVDEIFVIGHSIAGVDIPYFKNIDAVTMRKATWKVYYYRESEKQEMLGYLINDCEIDSERIEMSQSDEFFDL